MLITVLLKLACTLAMANGTFFFSFFLPGARRAAGAPSAAAAGASLAAASFAGGAAPSFESVFLAAFGGLSALGAPSFAAPSFGSFGSAMDLLHPHPFLPTGAFFLPATVLRGPLRVRALVCVLCPRTGRLRRVPLPPAEPTP